MDDDEKERLPFFVTHLKGPFLPRPKPAIYIFEYLASRHGGLSPRSFIVGKFFAFLIQAWVYSVDVEKVSWHV